MFGPKLGSVNWKAVLFLHETEYRKDEFMSGLFLLIQLSN
jgi:hypothetical protein